MKLDPTVWLAALIVVATEREFKLEPISNAGFVPSEENNFLSVKFKANSPVLIY